MKPKIAVGSTIRTSYLGKITIEKIYLKDSSTNQDMLVYTLIDGREYLKPARGIADNTIIVQAKWGDQEKNFTLAYLIKDYRLVYSEIVYEGYTSAQLHDAFDIIKPKHDWKNPIKARIAIDAFKVCNTACIFFTGGWLEEDDSDGVSIYVSSPGYYNIIGA